MISIFIVAQDLKDLGGLNNENSDVRYPMSPEGIGSSSVRLPDAFSGSTGVAPWFWWGTVSFIRFASEKLGAADLARLGVSMARQWLYARFRRRRSQVQR